MTEYEGNINAKLRILFQQAGLDAKPEHMPGDGRRIDVMVQFDSYKVAVECELIGTQSESAKKAEAVKDARSRLGPKPVADIAIAVVYPKGTTESLVIDDVVSYAVVYRNADTLSRQTRLYNNEVLIPARSESVTWNKCSVRQLINIIENVGNDLGDPNVLVAKLKQALDVAVDCLSAEEVCNVAKSLDMDFEQDSSPAARRAFLVVASAAMFHARLDTYLPGMKPDIDARNGKPYNGPWPPKTLHACFDADNTPVALLDAWNMILAVDYKPIFEAGRTVLHSCNSNSFTNAVRCIIGWARDAVGLVAGLRHDLLGRIFHVVLGNARYDGSYYTSMPAAVLLAGLAIRDHADMPSDISKMKIMDPACGTGTLLMAAAERVRDIRGAEAGCDSSVLIEKVLSGIDINVTALHMAATTLGLLSPTTQFRRMDIRQLPLGKVSDSKIPKSGKLAGIVSAGSLELYDSGGLDAFTGWAGRGSANIETGEKRAAHTYKHSVDHLIMNPPFTRHDIRHDQLGRDVEKLVKIRESEIFRESYVELDWTSSGIPFLLLGEHLVKHNAGAMSFVFPLSGATAPSTASVRRFLAKRFHIDTIIVPQDPERFWFSENTRVSEMLVVMRRGGGGDKKEAYTYSTFG